MKIEMKGSRIKTMNLHYNFVSEEPQIPQPETVYVSVLTRNAPR